MTDKPADPQNPDQPSFEAALTQLEGIVRQLEDGEIGLNEALGCYEQGVRLLRQCYELLQKAERRIELLSGVDAEGKPITTPVEDSALTLNEKAQQRSRRRSASQGSHPSQKGSVEPKDDMDVSGGLF